MAKRCTTVPGYGACCAAMQAGVRPGQAFRKQMPNGTERCAVCNVVQSHSKRHPGQNVFQFRWVKGQVCGIGPGGCPTLAQGGGQVGNLPQITQQF